MSEQARLGARSRVLGPSSSDSPTVRERRLSPAAGPGADAIGNQALQWLTRGRVQPKLTIGSTGDPEEHEADRAAEKVAQGGGCGGPSCTSASPCTTCQTAAGSSGGSGTSLDNGTRAKFESNLGHDFSGVRIHTGKDAAAAARSLGALAFTVGSDVVFGDRQYAPATPAGDKLLAHELTHVAQQQKNPSPVVRRAPGGVCSPDAPVCEGPADVPPSGMPSAAPDAKNQLDFDPCDVDVSSLTNDALMRQLGRGTSFISSNKKGPDYYAYANLMRRLISERNARMRAGHVWMGADSWAAPPVLYKLGGGEYGQIQVTVADAAGEASAVGGKVEGSVLTPGQFQTFLTKNNIPTVDAETYFADQKNASGPPLEVMPPLPPMPKKPPVDITPFLNLTGGGAPYGAPYGSSAVAGGGLGQSYFDVATAKGISPQVFGNNNNVNMNNARQVAGYRSNWRGDLPELSFGSGDAFSRLIYRDLNKVQANFPVFDFQNPLTNSYISVKSVVPTNPNAAPNFQTYDRGFTDMIGVRRPGTFANSVTLLNTTPGAVVSNSYLAVNNDHVVPYRNRVEALIRATPNDYGPLLDALLAKTPIKIGGTTYSSWASLQNAQATVPTADYQSAIEDLSKRARSRVIASGYSTPELRNLQGFRERFQNVPQAEFERLAAPELIEAERFGGGAAGTRAAIGRSMLRGGGGGMVVTAGFDLFRYMYDPEANPLDAQRLVTDVGLGGFGGAVASGIETSIAVNSSRSLLTEVAAGGVASGGAPLASRVFGGTIGGGVAAPLVVMGSMLLDSEHEYTGIDYTAKGTRAFISGAAAGGGGALAAAGVGALAGSEVPILGNIVGAGVGLLIYWLVDSSVGDAVEKAIRLEMGEGGCPRPKPAASSSSGSSHPYMGACFTGDTLILLSDGRSKPIAEIIEGEEVMAYDQRAHDVRGCMVNRVRTSHAMEYRRIFVEDGRSLRCTEAHPVLTPLGWVPAGTLQPDDTVFRYDPQRPELVPTRVTSVERHELSQTVYDLTVDPCHTYFAEGILVHNKNM